MLARVSVAFSVEHFEMGGELTNEHHCPVVGGCGEPGRGTPVYKGASFRDQVWDRMWSRGHGAPPATKEELLRFGVIPERRALALYASHLFGVPPDLDEASEG
jgi:hypothetical protein